MAADASDAPRGRQRRQHVGKPLELGAQRQLRIMIVTQLPTQKVDELRIRFAGQCLRLRHPAVSSVHRYRMTLTMIKRDGPAHP
jgi:hypothetical protein